MGRQSAWRESRQEPGSERVPGARADLQAELQRPQVLFLNLGLGGGISCSDSPSVPFFGLGSLFEFPGMFLNAEGRGCGRGSAARKDLRRKGNLDYAKRPGFGAVSWILLPGLGFVGEIIFRAEAAQSANHPPLLKSKSDNVGQRRERCHHGVTYKLGSQPKI